MYSSMYVYIWDFKQGVEFNLYKIFASTYFWNKPQRSIPHRHHNEYIVHKCVRQRARAVRRSYTKQTSQRRTHIEKQNQKPARQTNKFLKFIIIARIIYFRVCVCRRRTKLG